MDQRDAPWTGRLLGGRYHVGRRLGRGGMGEVYEATQRDLDRRVALKILRPELARYDEDLKRFRREAEAAAALVHPNIVQVTDFGHAPGEPAFLVMEYLQGAPLSEAISRD